MTPAIQTKTDYPPKQSACQTCQFFPESSLSVFRAVRPELERHLIWPITPPGPHHPRRCSWTAGTRLTLSLCSFPDFSAGRAQRIHSAGGLSFEPFAETLLVIVLMSLHIRVNVSSPLLLLLSPSMHQTLAIKLFLIFINALPGNFPGGPVVKEFALQCRGHGFDPWSGK